MDLVQFIKRTGLDSLNVVVFQVTVGAEKATLRGIKKKHVLIFLERSSLFLSHQLLIFPCFAYVYVAATTVSSVSMADFSKVP